MYVYRGTCYSVYGVLKIRQLSNKNTLAYTYTDRKGSIKDDAESCGDVM